MLALRDASRDEGVRARGNRLAKGPAENKPLTGLTSSPQSECVALLLSTGNDSVDESQIAQSHEWPKDLIQRDVILAKGIGQSLLGTDRLTVQVQCTSRLPS